MVDVYSRMIVGWGLTTHLRAELALERTAHRILEANSSRLTPSSSRHAACGLGVAPYLLDQLGNDHHVLSLAGYFSRFPLLEPSLTVDLGLRLTVDCVRCVH